ncbi:MAG TPA: MFS transporter [Anseongella sp.]
MTKPSSFRWTIVTLLFFATTINYIDRQVIGLLKSHIEQDQGWTEADYGFIVSAFQAAYAIGLLGCGRLLDRIGVRRGYAAAVVLWSLGGILHAGVRSVAGFSMARAVLGLGEAANFPAAIKTVAEWFPKKDRAYVTGIFNSGSSVGAIVAPLIVTLITLHFGWKSAFILTGAMGFVWVACWFLLYRAPEKHPRVNARELQYILSDQENEQVRGLSWRALLKHRETYIICLSRFLTDWVWWFFLFWAPDFLEKEQGVDMKASILPLVIIYTMAGLGGIAGGFISSRLIQSGHTVNDARKTAILISALAALPLSMATQTTSVWLAAGIIGMAAAAHSMWASNIFTIVSDIYPKNAVATMTGLAGFVAAVGGTLAASFIGLILEFTGSYLLVFSVASVMYLMAWILLRVFIPVITPRTFIR